MCLPTAFGLACLSPWSKYPFSIFASRVITQSSYLSLNAPYRPFMTPELDEVFP